MEEFEERGGGGVKEASEGENSLGILAVDLIGVNRWRERGLGETEEASAAIEERWSGCGF